MALFSGLANLDRMRQITQVLAKHGFGELLGRTELASLLPAKPTSDAAPKRTLPERCRLAMQELGPTFVKLGQILSTRADLLPPEFVAEFQKLQEDVPSIPWEEVKRTVEESIGAAIELNFADFSEQPLASASIGQVHRAQLRSPEGPIDVAVKVQRPGIRATIERDLDLLYLLARLIERAVPESSTYSPTGMVSEFDRAIMAELDYTLEAQNGERFARNFQDNASVRFPKVYRHVSSRRLLVAEFFDGLKIQEAIAKGFPGDRIAKGAVQVISQMVFIDGLFHADPHPGNIRILGTPEAPVLGLLDLGLVGSISAEMREKATDLMMAAIRQDIDELADALLAMGRPRGKVDREAFRAEVGRLAQLHLGKSIKDVQVAAMIRDLVQGAVKFEIEMPVEMIMVGKSLMTVEGIGKTIYPDLDVFEEARPFFLKLIWQRYSPERIGMRLLKTANRLSGAATEIPPLAAEILDDLRRGQLRFQAEDPGLGRAAERLGRRIALGLLGGAWIASATALWIANHPQAAALGLLLAAVSGAAAWGRLPSLRKR